jgi:drug/metabolite transporter (DMT)-like permease
MRPPQESFPCKQTPPPRNSASLCLQWERRHPATIRLPENSPNSSRRWTVIASGLLLLAIALVVIYAGRTAFHSPVAVMVLAAIGLVAVLLQVRLRPDSPVNVRAPRWLNVVGIICALFALFADRLRLSSNLSQVMALSAVGCFAVSSVVVLDAIRKSRVAPK